MADPALGDLERAIEHGDAEIAIEIGRECTQVSLRLALRLLPIAALQDPDGHQERALHWLARWITESSTATLEQAAEAARALAHLPADPSALEAIHDLTRVNR